MGKNIPNIIYIMADDMGYGDISCYNPESKIDTKNIDKLAEEGVIFTDCHSPSAVCTPTRYGVLTGRYCWRSKLKKEVLFGYEPPLIEKDRITVASLLKNNGYETACFGKWHLGLEFPLKEGESVDFDRQLPWPDDRSYREVEQKIDFSKPVSGGPTELGFDYFFGTANSGTCLPPYAFIENDKYVKIPEDYLEKAVFTGRSGIMAKGWKFEDVDPIVTEKSVQYIRSKKNNSKPFFMYICPVAPHEPCLPSFVPEFARGKSKAGPRGDLVWLFDWTVGQIMKALDDTGLSDNTIIFVTSDNGALPGDRVINEKGDIIWNIYDHKSCGMWTGHKSHIWEGGHREPLVVRWPDYIKPGERVNSLTCLTDFFATCADIAGINIPDGEAEDSISFLPSLLRKDQKDTIRDSVISHSFHGVFAIRKGDWKLVIGTTGSGGFQIETYGTPGLPPSYGKGPVKGAKGQLYDLKNDPEEKNNLYDKYPDKVEELKKLLEEKVNDDANIE